MTKQEAVDLLGANTHQEAAKILGLSKGAFSAWPDHLTTMHSDRVLGAAVRIGKINKDCPNQSAALSQGA